MASPPSIPPEMAEPAFSARSYQVEMFEASLKENIIVVMGTGSGKTHIALLRIMHVLENSNGTKLIWFLAPTVALCLQQQKVIAKHIPAARSRTLTGLDNVELWTEQKVWDAVLNEIQVVVSTPAVLLDAMTHGFVRISRLELLVFDEAHHTVRNHPANKIMQYFYHPTLKQSGPESVPRILGLTASAASNSQDLLMIESNLSSVCTTPQINRSDLLAHTHKPELERVLYTPEFIAGAPPWGGTQKALLEAWETLDLEDDPYVKKLKRESPNGEALQAVLSSGKTYCSTQLKNFVSTVVHISEELGIWAADYFIDASVQQLRARVHSNSLMLDLDNDEKKYLVDVLSKLPVPKIDVNATNPADFLVSPKFNALLEFLGTTDETDFSGLIFVRRRTTVAVMAHLLSIHPLTRDRFRSGSFVGMSNSSNRKEMLGDLLLPKMQRNTLDEFRDGRKNLIIATDVLEEGIDVSTCSLVVSYNKPANLKSFVQRRGRARRRHSKYAMVLSTEDDISQLDKWRALEEVMEEAYQNEQRRLDDLRQLETITEDVNARFYIESTGALLTADNAMQHLFHFCSTLPSSPHVANNPEFSFETHDGGLLRGKVTLPSSVIPTARRAEGTSWWKTERAARKDAAFNAYKALYEHGLVNANLLPLTKEKEFTLKDMSIEAIQVVQGQYDPWAEWAGLWSQSAVHESRVVVRCGGHEAVMKMATPAAVPPLEPMTLYWDGGITFTLELEKSRPVLLTEENVQHMRTVTGVYLQATTTKQLGKENDYIALFSPDISHDDLATWLDRYQGHEPASRFYNSNRDRDPKLMGLVRNQERYGELLLFKQWLNTGTTLEIECDPYPKRRNLFHKPEQQPPQTLPRKRSLEDVDNGLPITSKKGIPAHQCTIDKLPGPEALFGRFIAPILSRLETSLTVSKLLTTILKDIPFSNTNHVLTAITTPLVQLDTGTDYQRYEFFGDSVLKYTVAFSLFYKHPTWHEGYLSQARDAVVQNSTLARAALESGLDKFILTKAFKARKWSAPLISVKLDTVSSSTSSERSLSSKILADIVESLIGAAYLDDGHEKAQSVICRFLPKFTLVKPTCTARPAASPALAPASPSPEWNDTITTPPQPHLINHAAIESQIGYNFSNPSLLLEALTHPSHHDTATQSYQRLEFLGDAVLDMLVVETILQHPRQLNQGDMTKIKQAVVNANLLAFLCLEFEWDVSLPGINKGDVSSKTGRHGAGNPSGEETKEEEKQKQKQKHHLYTHLRHNPSTPLLHNLANTTFPLHTHFRNAILTSLHHGKAYPWPPLSCLSPDKFLSDIIESMIGAIFVDSGGNLRKCKVFLERIGLLRYLNRILDEGVRVVHPMQRVQGMLQRIAVGVAVGRGVGIEEVGWRFGFRTVMQSQMCREDRDQDQVRVSGSGEDRNPASVLDEEGRVIPEGDGDGDGDADTNGEEEEKVNLISPLSLSPTPTPTPMPTPTSTEPEITPSPAPETPAEQDPGSSSGAHSYTCTIPLKALDIGVEDVVISGARSKEEAEVRAACQVLEILENRGEELCIATAVAGVADADVNADGDIGVNADGDGDIEMEG
ncbi:hypothetical protein BJX70DRAFT_401960 [Aspergillus crustosus]